MHAHRMLLASLAIAVAFAQAGSAIAQGYPTRPITMVVPFAAGGATDAIGRIVAEGMRATLAQPVIVENMGGAAGNLGTGRVARSVGDGYTFSIGDSSTHVANGAVYKLQHDVLKDFEPVALLVSNTYLVVARKTMLANDLKGLVAWLKANPGNGLLGTLGVGTPPHLGGVLFENATATRFQFVPALTSARPQAVGALLRYFRDLDIAEEAFQDACLRALRNWPQNGPPRDPAAWLIMVGRNVAIDGTRRRSKQAPLPPEETLSDLEDAEAELAERLDGGHYRDDILRLLFICCHPELPATQQIALALRVVSGLTVTEIARAFLVGESAMEQRITRAKSRVANADVPFETPGPVERAERLATVAAMIYLVFNEGYSASSGEAPLRAPLCEEAIRLGRLLLRLFPGEPEIMGLTALLLLQHARAPARFDAEGAIVLLEDQDRTRWNRTMIAEGLALIDKAMRHRRPGPYQVQAAIAALHAEAPRPEDTDWAQIDLLYATLERLQPSPVVTLNRAVAVSKTRGPAAALAMIEPLAPRLSGYFHFFGAKGGLLLQLGRTEEARVAFDRAIALAHTAAEAAHIRLHLDRLMKESAPAPEERGA